MANELRASAETGGDRDFRAAPIHVSDEELADLRDRLHRTRWPDAVPAAPWEAGTDLTSLRELCRVWADEYDWRPHEARLNALGPVAINVDGVDLHVFRARSRRADAIPLLIIHGWPGSIVEFRYILEPLVDPVAGQPAFDLVMPSLPGFGFGGKPSEPGWGITRTADAFAALMKMLGYKRYGVAGGDWGAIVGSRLAERHASAVLGFHTSAPLTGMHRQAWWAQGASEQERAMLARWDVRRDVGEGYLTIQATKPQSITVAQTDSPAGLAAWILEKFHGWSDGGLEAFRVEDLLTNLMFYWAPRSAASAAMFYYEARLDPEGRIHAPPEVPTAIAAYAHDTRPVSRRWAEPIYRIARYNDFTRGGHFGSLEQPEAYAADLAEFFGGLPRER